MFITDKLIYIQMQKTGCTHIASLLSNLFDGEQIGKHNAASDDLINSDTYFLSSIRNPWDWYVSLWAFGVQGKGSLMSRLTKRNYYRALKLALRNPLKNHSALLHELTKDVSSWRDVYDESRNIESFRKWLKFIHTPNNARWLGEGYGTSAIIGFCGFMSYRYLCLCCTEPRSLNNPKLISNYTDLVRFEKNACYIDFFIRQESLEDDFCRGVERVKVLTQEEKDGIWDAVKTNPSKRPFVVSDYYDKESIELIHSRDKLLIEKFDYAPPKIVEQDASPDGNSAVLYCRR